MFEHPRFRIHPQHADYYRMAMVFRPFVMAVHEPGFRSDAVNTDEFGLRVQHHLDGTRVEWPRLRDRVDRCSVLVGNSSAFSNDASSDRATLAYRLNELR